MIKQEFKYKNNTYTIYNCDFFDLNIEEKSIDAIITDPPYKLLKGHKIETNIEDDKLNLKLRKLLKKNGLYCFTHQAPYQFEFIKSCMNNGFDYRREYIWDKIIRNGPFTPRVHENIHVLGSGKLNVVRVPFDKKLYHTDSSIERHLAVLKKIYKSISNGTLNDDINKIQTLVKQKVGCSEKYNDDFYNTYTSATYKRMIHFIKILSEGVEQTSVLYCKAHNKQSFNRDENNVKHPTVKPLQVFDFLVKLASNENDLVLDPFTGSGTTALTCIDNNRNFIGCEIHREYFDIACERIEKHIEQKLMQLF